MEDSTSASSTDISSDSRPTRAFDFEPVTGKVPDRGCRMLAARGVTSTWHVPSRRAGPEAVDTTRSDRVPMSSRYLHPVEDL